MRQIWIGMLVLLLIANPLVLEDPTAPFDGYLVLDGLDDQAEADIVVGQQGETTIEAFFLLRTGSNSPIDRLEIAAASNWVLYVVRYSLGGTRTGCIGYLGPGGWEHCRTSAIAPNVWHHLALVVKEGQGQFYLDGAAFGSPRPLAPPVLNAPLTVGRNLDGTMDEVRISGRARYTSPFPIPSGKFQCDPWTIALWGFDEPPGSAVFGDRCGGELLRGQGGAHTEGGLSAAIRVFLPFVAGNLDSRLLRMD